MSEIPTGTMKIPFLPVPTEPAIWDNGQVQSIETLSDAEISDLGFLTRQQLRTMASNSPGSYWYPFGEANRYGYMTGARFAPVFHYFLTQLKIGDPGAKILSPSILNWDYTCIGCAGPAIVSCEGVTHFQGGYQCGKEWLKEFVSTYNSTYGENPPVDVWAIDLYPLDWKNTPNNDSSQLALYKNARVIHSEIVVQQLIGLREYLDTMSEYNTTPIWITEMALHVGYEGWEFDSPLDPVEPYHWDKMSDYLIYILDWLEENHDVVKIEKWFLFVTWKDIVDVGADGYMGIILFSGPNPDTSSLNCLGSIYRARSLGEGRFKCNSSGDLLIDN